MPHRSECLPSCSTLYVGQQVACVEDIRNPAAWLQEALHCVKERRESEDAATGVYMGVMYTEYLDTILAPQVCIHPPLSL